MGQLTRLTLLAIVALSLNHLRVTDACTCSIQHPQTQFCQSDFVAVVRVKEWSRPNDHEVAYRVKIHRLFKATPKARMIFERKPVRLWSPSSESLCGAFNLTPGKTWLISGRIIGGKPSISLCSLSMLWSEVTPRQRKGFRQLYHRGCVCQISYTKWWKKGAAFETSAGKQCLWESSPGPQDCQERHGICMLGVAGCYWVPSVAYKKCIIEHQRHREQQRTREP